MPSRQKSPASSPRTSRGLELVLCAVMVLLLVYGVTHGWRANPANHETKLQTPENAISASPTKWYGVTSRRSDRVRSPLEQALLEIQGEEDVDKREERLASLAHQIPVTAIYSELAELDTLPADEMVGDFRRQLLRRWAFEDGTAAAAWVEALLPGPGRTEALSDVAMAWADSSLNAAADWAQRLPDASERQATMLTVASEAVRSDPLEALWLVAKLPDEPGRNDLISRAASEWALQDGPEAVAWAEQISDENLRAKVLAGEAVSWAEKDPINAATLAVERLPGGRLQENTVVSIIQRWAQQQPEQAAAWVEEFPEGKVKNAALQSLAMLSQD